MPDLAYALIYITETATLLGGKKQAGGVMPRNGAISCRRELDQEILGVLESTLQLDSIACRESALHGLGHWQHYYPQRVGEIIDAFLMKHRVLRKELETYAVKAYTGYVL